MGIRVLHFGIGPIGAAIARQMATRKGFTTVGGVDTDPAKSGQDVGELLGIATLNALIYQNALDAIEKTNPDVVVLCTSSSVVKVLPQIKTVLDLGIPIVSTTEELAYATPSNRALIARIDELAKRANVAVLATGVNPGFVMDTLPIVLTAPCERVDAIRVDRVQDASIRRLPFQQKIGAGLTAEEFQSRVDDGTVRHVGLAESIYMIADALGWTIASVTDRIAPVIAKTDVRSQHIEVPAGRVCGLMQDGIGYINNEPLITLHMEASLGAPESYDHVTILGSPGLELKVIGGTHGDIATASMVVNSIPKVLSARPGYRTMRDLPLPSYCSGKVADERHSML